jgi:hypothetical protein
MKLKELNIFTLLPDGPSAVEDEIQTLPKLPSEETADLWFETVYFYIQARYCILDWVQIREWYKDREIICYAIESDSLDARKGAFFVWMIMAIASRFVARPENSCEAYYARAIQFVDAPLNTMDLTAVQALLILAQYSFRAPVRTANFYCRFLLTYYSARTLTMVLSPANSKRRICSYHVTGVSSALHCVYALSSGFTVDPPLLATIRTAKSWGSAFFGVHTALTGKLSFDRRHCASLI